MKRILFICIENSCRSQMAEGFARHYGRDTIAVFSAGSKASGIVNPTALAVMKEKGIDISSQTSKGIDTLPRGKFDVVVSMGCGDQCPSLPAERRIEWKIKDPKGSAIDVFREVRDEIEVRVRRFVEGIVRSSKNDSR